MTECIYFGNIFLGNFDDEPENDVDTADENENVEKSDSTEDKPINCLNDVREKTFGCKSLLDMMLWILISPIFMFRLLWLILRFLKKGFFGDGFGCTTGRFVLMH